MKPLSSSAMQRDQERWWKSELKAHSHGWEWWGYLSKMISQKHNSCKLLTYITICPELFFNHSYLCPALMSSVTTLLLLPWASGSLRMSSVSLLQHLHLAIRASSPHLIKIQLTLMPNASTAKSHKNLSVSPRQLHQSGEEQRPISHLIAPKQEPLGDAFTSRCWGAEEGWLGQAAESLRC